MRRTGLLIVGGIAFVAVSLLIAAALTGESQRGAVLDVLRAQADGDVPGVLDNLDRCDARCVAGVKVAIAQTRGAGTGPLKLVRTDERAGFLRVVWVRGERGVPVVQCLRVERDGSPFSGRDVRIVGVRPPLADNQDPC